MTEPTLAPAKFMAKTDARGREIPETRRVAIPVHFNPESLDITYTNTVQRGNRNQPAQVVNETTAKLSMELVYDTSLRGTDVRQDTHKIARLMDPSQQTPRRRNAAEVKVPAIVIFRWGTILFEGYIDSYKEKVEFFSPEGVPLRAVVTLSLTQQQRSFSPVPSGAGPPAGGPNGSAAPGGNDPVRPLARNESLTATAGDLGDARAARELARANGVENMRHPEVDAIVVSRQPGRTAVGGAAAVPGVPTAGQPAAGDATEALFAGLRTQGAPTAGRTPRGRLDPSVGEPAGQALSLAGRSGFGLGGEVDDEAGAGLTADVGLDADIELGIQFEE